MAHETPDSSPESIIAAVSELGIGGTTPSLDVVFSGGQCQIYKLSFADHESLAVRIPHRVDDNPDSIIYGLYAEWQVVQKLEDKGFRWAPRCRGRSRTFDNPVGYPFLVLTWVEGSTLRWGENVPPQPQRDELLWQLAAIQLSLIHCTQEEGSVTANEFFQRLIKSRRTRVLEGKRPGLSEQDYDD
ncbi:hypothetical protein EJ06DRAFT_530869 [Trichodelitschia bisporula]|uniref:Aminoglycoside phosphotransferase domain-containing protein n=1 Tax=Trichodelitschia bisporula TaxID=703511 RepID=A0A6G1HWC3_9PEZI|nr:hypothetical protein EJ06DRAFT_530869 [Trichodelitschia bisporula]